MKTYYAGVYQDERGKVLQVSEDIDGLSCEILAEPAIAKLDTSRVSYMLSWAMNKARASACHHLEINCSRGMGSYQWLKVDTPDKSEWTRSDCPICGRGYPHKVDYKPVTCGSFACLQEASRRGLLKGV